MRMDIGHLVWRYPLAGYEQSLLQAAEWMLRVPPRAWAMRASIMPPGAWAPFSMAEMTDWRVPRAPGQFGLGDSRGCARMVDQLGQLQASLGLDGGCVVLGSLGLSHGGQGLLSDLFPRGRGHGGTHRLLPFFSARRFAS